MTALSCIGLVLQNHLLKFIADSNVSNCWLQTFRQQPALTVPIWRTALRNSHKWGICIYIFWL